MNNNWRANRAWNKIEDKKVIIDIGSLSHLHHLTMGHQLLQILGWGGVGSGHSAPIMGHVSIRGFRQVGKENPLRDNQTPTLPG